MKSPQFSKQMRNLGFVEDLDVYRRGFVVVYVDGDNLSIGHTINKRRTPIQVEHLKEWINYFGRL